MRMSDWSSDVCSSDLLVGRQIGPSLHLAHIIQQGPQFALMRMDIFGQTPAGIGEQHVMDESDAAGRAHDICEDGLHVGKIRPAAMVSYLGNIWRSEERRVGKECASQCQYWWARVQ